MNANIVMINATCSIHTHAASPSQKVSTTGGGKSFSLIQDEISSETVPCEDTTSYNIEQPTPPKKPIEKTTDESNSKRSGKVETECPLENQEKTELENSSPVCQMNEKADSEPVLEIETLDLIEQNDETGGETKAIIQTAPPIPNVQPESQPPGAEEIVKSIPTGHVVADESQTIRESTQSNTVVDIPTSDNFSGSTENTDNIPTFKPTETNAPNVPANIDNTGKSFTDTQTDNSHLGETKQNEPIISDSSVSVENSEKTISNTKELFVDGLTDNNNKASTDVVNTTTTLISPVSTPAKSPETLPETPSTPMEADSAKRAPTDESTSEFQVPKEKESTQAGENLSNTSDFKSLNVSEVQTSTGQPETQNHSTDNDSFQEHIEQIYIQNDNPIPITQQSLSSIENPKAADVPMQPSPNDITTDVGKQILESIQNSSSQQGGNQQITVRLNPPELGKVFIKFQEQNSELTGLLEVNKAETRVEIEQALPQIIRDLANAGIQIRRLDVVLSEENRSGYEALEDQSPQDSGLYEQNSTGSQSWDSDAYTNGMNDWSTKNTTYQPVSELEQTPVGEDSINILI